MRFPERLEITTLCGQVENPFRKESLVLWKLVGVRFRHLGQSSQGLSEERSSLAIEVESVWRNPLIGDPIPSFPFLCGGMPLNAVNALHHGLEMVVREAIDAFLEEACGEGARVIGCGD